MVGAWVVQLVQGVLDGAAAELQSHMLGGYVFKGVRLVENDGPVIGQQTEAAAAQGEVGEEQGMVDDEDVRPEHGTTGLEVEASGVVLAVAAEAVAAVALDEVPHIGARLKGQVALAAILGLPRPFADLHELLGGALFSEEQACLLLRDAQAAQTEVVGATLAKDSSEVAGEDGLEKGDVLLQQLFLKADRLRGDDDLVFLAPLDSGKDGGDEVGERLPDTRAGFDHQMMRSGD